MVYDIIVVGAGVIGSLLARELSKYNLSVLVLEKENDVAMGASKANSGIVHGGFDPEPNTLKAELNVKGVELLYTAAKELNVPFKQNGSLVLAFNKEDDEQLKKLYERGIKNGVSNLKLLTREQALQIEPNISPSVTSALCADSAGIICPYELTIAAMGNAIDNGVTLVRNFCVNKITAQKGVFTVSSTDERTYTSKYLINCAGAYADKIAKMAGNEFFKIIARAGEYILLDKEQGNMVAHTIFMTPSKEGKGVLVTPTVDGNLLTGPTASQKNSPDDTSTTQDGINAVLSLAKKSVPNVDFRQTITSFCGVRASHSGGDFIIEQDKKIKSLVHVAAIDSPGLTSSVAIAKKVVDILRKMEINLKEKTNWDGTRPDMHAFRKMTDAQKNEIIKQNSDYGKIICRCETVSKGEIIAAIHREPKAYDLDAVKRRTRQGMGRCQGGFCMPYVMKILSEELGTDMELITKSGENSRQLGGKL